MTRPGSLDLDPGSHGKQMNSWCVSFETEFTTLPVAPNWGFNLFLAKRGEGSGTKFGNRGFVLVFITNISHSVKSKNIAFRMFLVQFYDNSS